MMNNNWDETGRPVKNHLCEGMKEFQARAFGSYDYNCIPIFDEEGNCRGCDDVNYNKIQFCPFCGTKLND